MNFYGLTKVFLCYGYLSYLYHRRVFIQVCLQIDPESYEWGLSARSVDLKWNPRRRMIKGELNRSMSLFLEIDITQIEASVMLFAFVILITQFLENDMFSIQMDPWMYFFQVRVLKNIDLWNFPKTNFTFSSVIEYRNHFKFVIVL